MAISIHKILSVKKEHNALTVGVVLDDEVSKKLTYLGGLTDDNTAARNAILARGQELFDNGREWSETPSSNIETPAKRFLESLPDLTTATNAVDNISNLADAKVVLNKLVRAVFALKDVTEG